MRRKAILVAALVLVAMSLQACASRQQVEENRVSNAAKKSLIVARTAVQSTARAVEDAYQQKLIDETRYLELRSLVLASARRYNQVLKYYGLTKGVAAGDIEAIVQLTKQVVEALDAAKGGEK